MQKLIYVITGKEESLVNSECEKLLDTIIKPQQRATGLFNAEAARISVSEILDELRTAPFLTEKRVVVVKGADDFVSNNRQILESYFENPCHTGILILTVKSWPATTKLAKKLPKIGKLIKTVELKAWQLPRHLIEYARDAHKKKLTTETAELLIELVGDELTRLYNEIDKLALFAHTEKSITESHVASLIGHNRIYGVFAVIDACLASNISQALARLRNMFAEDKNAEYTVIGAFAFHFRRLFDAKVMLDKGVYPDEVIKRLRIWGNKDGFFTQVRRMSLKQIGSILQQLAEIDFKIKTGQTKAEVAVEQLVLSSSLDSWHSNLDSLQATSIQHRVSRFEPTV